MSTGYSPPDDWNPSYISKDEDALNFGKYRGVPAKDIPASYLLFLEDRGWIYMSMTYREALEAEHERRLP